MKRVYLDMNKWIDLSRAYHAHTAGRAYRDALTVAQAGVEAGVLSFPLSSAHYKELAHRKDWRSRYRLAEVMEVLSRFHAIASLIEVVPAELDRALQGRFGRPVECLPLQPFGFGVAFAFHDSELRYAAPAVLPDGVTRRELEAVLRIPFEREMLRGLAKDTPAHGIDLTWHFQLLEGYAKRQNERGVLLRELGYAKGDALERATMAKVIADIVEPFKEALTRARVSADEFTTREQLTSLLQSIPSEWIVYEFERARHACGGDWKRGDLTDICALSVAVVYCDVVVTEKQWVHILRAAGLDKLNNTVVTDDVAELAEILVSLDVDSHAA